MKLISWVSAPSVLVGISFLVLASGRTGTARAEHSPLLPVASVEFDAQQDPEDGFAWDEFAALVHPSSARQYKGSEPPVWVSWYNKCEAGLTDACRPSSPDGKSDEPADRSAAEIPRQLLADFNRIGTDAERVRFVDDFEQSSQLDSVLFNPVAADSIRRSDLGRANSLDLAIRELDLQNLSGADRRLPAGTFALGSEVVKLIWEIIPANGREQLRLYDPMSPQILEGSLQLLPTVSWLARYKIDTRSDIPCPESAHVPPYGSPTMTQTLPINCFYWFPIHATPTDKSCSHLSPDIETLWCSPALKGREFLVFLVGFHVMKLTPGSPDWIWSTYYWTRETNEKESGHDWNAPWNHFHQVTTTAIRENAGDHAICYNPYLEGHQTNGLKANCLSCHSFAAYAADTEKDDTGTKHGGEYPYPKAKRLHDEQNYFRGAVQTSFIWSISTSQNKPNGKGPGATLFRTLLRNALLQEFQSQ